MIDVAIYETGSGGDVILNGNDLEMTSGLFNMVFFGLFGGNPGFITPDNPIETEQRFDWWGNSLLFPNNKSAQFNSRTEHLLNTVALNSEGREVIENGVRDDLAFMRDFATVTQEVSVVSDNKISILITLLELENQENKQFQFIWDVARGELIEKRII